MTANVGGTFVNVYAVLSSSSKQVAHLRENWSGAIRESFESSITDIEQRAANFTRENLCGTASTKARGGWLHS